MACDNRLQHLPLELFFKITNHVTIFDLNNMEKSGLFELNDQGISDVIQAAFEQPKHINVNVGAVDQAEFKIITKLLFRCGTGLRSLIARRKNQPSFLYTAHRYDKKFGKKLAASCPNIERFAGCEYYGYNSTQPLRDYIRNVEVSKLVEIYEDDLTLEDFQILFTLNLKSVTVNCLGKFIASMEKLSVSRPNFGTNIERLTILPIRNFNSFQKLINFFPNLTTIKMKATNDVKCIYNREQIYSPDFEYQLKLISKYSVSELPYINKEHGEKFDLSSIIKYRPDEYRFDANVIDQLTNLQTLQLRGNDMMSAFSDYLSDATFKSLKKLNFTELNLNAETLPKFQKILLTGRFFIRSIVCSYAFGVHSALIPLLHKFYRNAKYVDIQLKPADTEPVTLSAVERKLLNEVGITYKSNRSYSTLFKD